MTHKELEATEARIKHLRTLIAHRVGEYLDFTFNYDDMSPADIDIIGEHYQQLIWHAWRQPWRETREQKAERLAQCGPVKTIVRNGESV